LLQSIIYIFAKTSGFFGGPAFMQPIRAI